MDTRQSLIRSTNVLNQIYTNVITLNDFLKTYESKNPTFRPNVEDFIKKSDKFLSFLQQTVLCSNRETEDIIPEEIKISHAFKRRELFMFVIRYVTNSYHGFSDNHFNRSDLHNAIGRDVYRTENNMTTYPSHPSCLFENTLNKMWKLLHSMIGDDMMYFVMTKFSIFTPVINEIMLQVAGKPILDAAKSKLNTQLPIIKSRKRKSDWTYLPWRKTKRRCLIRKFTESGCKLVGNLDHKDHKSDIKNAKESAKDTSKVIIKKSRLLYSRFTSGRCSKSFILSKASSTNSYVLDLIATILNPSQNKCSTVNKSSVRRKIKKLRKKAVYVKLLPIIKKMIRWHKRLNYNCLLDHYCNPLVTESNGNEDRLDATSYSTYQNAKNAHIPKYKVMIFVKAFCKRILPIELFGSKGNYNSFKKNVKRLINQQKYEKMTINEFTRDMKLTNVTWLSSKTGVTSKSHFKRNADYFTKVLSFVLNRVIIPLLAYFFYVTEFGNQRNHLFYYRKDTWKSIQSFAMESLCSSYTHINENIALEEVKSQRCLGISQVKLLPKDKNVRLVVDMTATKCSKFNSIPINIKLKSLLSVLSWERNANINNSKFCLSDMNKVYCRWKDFFVKTKELKKDEPYYFVSIDVAGCFDSIPHEKLLGIIEKKLCSIDYRSRTVAMVSVDHKRFLRKKKHTFISSGIDCLPFEKFIISQTKDKIPKKMFGCVVSNPILYKSEEKSTLLQLLRKHLCHNIVQCGSEFYMQKKGIPQGANVSSVLCDFFLDHIENNVMSELPNKEECLLMRWVDDSLLVTKSKLAAETFLEGIINELGNYDCQINKRKTKINFETQKVEGIATFHQRWLPWCGLLLDTETLEIKADYSGYTGKPLRNIISIDLSRKPGRAIKAALQRTVKLKVYLVLLDPLINSTFTIHLNVYQAFLFAAKKFHVVAKRLPKGRSVDRNVRYFMFEVILSLPKEFYVSWQRRLSKVNGAMESPCVPYCTLRCLCLMAFRDLFLQHSSSYSKLLPLAKKLLRRSIMNNKLKNIQISRMSESELRQQSTVFKAIK